LDACGIECEDSVIVEGDTEQDVLWTVSNFGTVGLLEHDVFRVSRCDDEILDQPGRAYHEMLVDYSACWAALLTYKQVLNIVSRGSEKVSSSAMHEHQVEDHDKIVRVLDAFLHQRNFEERVLARHRV
jgi:hypothetical protein